MKGWKRVGVMAAGFAVAGSLSAIAGGDDYDALNDTEALGPAYFGFVRDTRGSAVPQAQVVLKPKSGEPVTIDSNVLGLYRSHIRQDVVPEEVEVSCNKSGYRQVSVNRRPRLTAQSMFIETDCTLQKL